jgi:oligopeptide/dipeptide ABC transporter ATP-binding protein
VEGLRTRFRTRQGWVNAVDDVSFSVKRGQVLGIVGESGSGKSATALSLMRLIDPPGEVDPDSVVRFNGVDLLRLSERDMRSVRGRDIGMIFQEPMTSLNPVLKVGDQISEVLLAHETVTRKAAGQRAVAMLAQVGIAEPERRSHEYPFELSGGMRQRVMIAIATACRPKLLIADEPTTALDVTIQAQILLLLSQLRDQTEMAMVIITHDLGVVAEVADDVAVMYAGKIVELGPTRDVIDDPQHPYTEALVHSSLDLRAPKDRPLSTIPGNIPGPGQVPPGCRFAPRCEHVFEPCGSQPPAFGTERRWSACWLRQAAPTAGGER